MNAVEISTLAAVIGVCVALVFNLIGTRRATREIDKKGVSDMTTVVVKLENIGNGITEIKSDLRNVRADVNENRERIVALESSAKQAHKRLDDHLRGSDANRDR